MKSQLFVRYADDVGILTATEIFLNSGFYRKDPSSISLSDK